MPMRETTQEELIACRANLDALKIRARLGRKVWAPPVVWGEGWQFYANDGRKLFVTWWPRSIDTDYDYGCDWIHASISGAMGTMPRYEDLKLMHAAVFNDGHAYQIFVPPAEHINTTVNVLHLWGRADGQPVLPNFGRFGDI
jgi:anaerobic selenocysteine-containing dehydrogenase